MRYLIDLPAVPAVGAQLVLYRAGRRHRLTLTGVNDPWRAGDVVLHWRDEDGVRYTSGLRSDTLDRVSS